MPSTYKVTVEETDDAYIIRSPNISTKHYVVIKGGPGSGHYGHAGRRGHRGGSLPSASAMSIRTGRDATLRQASAKISARRAAAKKAEKKKALEKLPIGVRNDKMEKLNLHEDVKAAADEVVKRATGDKNPDVDSIDYIMQAYEFTDEKSGFHTEVTSIEAYTSSYGSMGKTTIYGQVYNKDGESVGEFVRVVRGDGEVHNDYFGMSMDSQGTGFGKRFYQHQEEMNLAAGIKETTIFANLDVGGYAWAKMGYDFQHSSTRSEIGARLFTSWKNNDPIAQDLRTKMTFGTASEYDDAQTIFKRMETRFEAMKSWEMAAFTTSDGQRIGKDVMLGSNWDAVKVLDETSDGWNVGQIYYNQ